MSNPQWTVSIIAQYSEKDEFASICYSQLIGSIVANRHENVHFYVMQYHKENEETTFFSYDYTSAVTNRTENTHSPESTQNFYESPAVMVEFFNNYSLKHASSRHFLLTWGHGAGFGLFAEGDLPEMISRLIGHEHNVDKTLQDKIRNAVLLYNQLYSSGAIGNPRFRDRLETFGLFLESSGLLYFVDKIRLEELMKGIQQVFRVMTIEDFAGALAESFGKAGKTIDFMYAMNCYMQMFETGYLLKDVVRYFGTAENFQLFPGPDYDALFEDLATTYAVPQPDLQQLSKSIIRNYEKKYERGEVIALLGQFPDSRFNVSTIIKESCISITNLSLYETLRREMDQLATLLKTQPALYPTVQQARKRCHPVSSTNYGIIDIAHFCKQLLKMQIPHPPLTDILHTIIRTIDTQGQLVVSIKEAPSLCLPPAGSPPSTETVCPHGISIFFPKDQNNSRSSEYVHYIMEHIYQPNASASANVFLEDSQWDEFVIDYFFSDLEDD